MLIYLPRDHLSYSKLLIRCWRKQEETGGWVEETERWHLSHVKVTGKYLYLFSKTTFVKYENLSRKQKDVLVMESGDYRVYMLCFSDLSTWEQFVCHHFPFRPLYSRSATCTMSPSYELDGPALFFRRVQCFQMILGQVIWFFFLFFWFFSFSQMGTTFVIWRTMWWMDWSNPTNTHNLDFIVDLQKRWEQINI